MNDNHSLDSSTFWHELTLTLSNDGISSSTINIKRLNEILKSTVRTDSRPFVVIFINSMEELNTLKSITEYLPMSYPRWLILFYGDSNSPINQFCRNPYGNLLNLNFDTELITSCYGSNFIEEWWSRKENFTNRQQIGKFIGESNKIEWSARKAFYEIRIPPEGLTFRISLLQGSHYFWMINGEFYGFFAPVLTELSKKMNFSIGSVIIANSSGTRNSVTSEWSGMIGQIARKKADLGIAAFSMTKERMDVVDFTFPVGIGDCRFYYRKPNGLNLRWKAYLEVFEGKVWAAIICSLLATVILLTLIEYRNNGYRSFRMIVDNYLNIWGICCQQGLSRFPERASLRIIYISTFLSVGLLSAIYSGSLISFITVRPTTSLFNTVEEFVDDGTYKLIVVTDGADYSRIKGAKSVLMQRLMALIKIPSELPINTKQAYDQVCNERVAFYSNEMVRATMQDSIPCEIASFKTGEVRAMGMIMQFHSKYTPFVNHHFQRFKSNGMLQRLQQVYFSRSNPRDHVPPYTQMLFEEIYPILYLLIGGCFTAVVVLVLERIYCRNRDQLRNQKNERWIGNNRNIRNRYAHFMY
ncbi:glutamate receptor ionotropic, kainate 5 [Fopius arisanus]|uniref:Glutamate receptor ionotropic, kainate 5 n=1 Tax=Fopius arisanus TaxID=64838 RepID=A0A9R1TXS6_9HYME|nr:PREDICTED: glutamate receptor ionotropic, kainate 5-like [Fopius arisanus]